jgi:hypothetical protein
MALKGMRQVNPYAQRLDFFMDEVAERGNVCVISTGGSGVAMDQGNALATVAASPSGTSPLGMLLQDMVNKDLTRTHLNYYKDECQKGGKVLIARKGWFVTNRVTGTPTIGATAYLANSGLLSATVHSVGGIAATPKVGQFLSTLDEDGYAKVEIELPTL